MFWIQLGKRYICLGFLHRVWSCLIMCHHAIIWCQFVGLHRLTIHLDERTRWIFVSIQCHWSIHFWWPPEFLWSIGSHAWRSDATTCDWYVFQCSCVCVCVCVVARAFYSFDWLIVSNSRSLVSFPSSFISPRHLHVIDRDYDCSWQQIRYAQTSSHYWRRQQISSSISRCCIFRYLRQNRSQYWKGLFHFGSRDAQGCTKTSTTTREIKVLVHSAVMWLWALVDCCCGSL